MYKINLIPSMKYQVFQNIVVFWVMMNNCNWNTGNPWIFLTKFTNFVTQFCTKENWQWLISSTTTQWRNEYRYHLLVEMVEYILQHQESFSRASMKKKVDLIHVHACRNHEEYSIVSLSYNFNRMTTETLIWHSSPKALCWRYKLGCLQFF